MTYAHDDAGRLLCTDCTRKVWPHEQLIDAIEDQANRDGRSNVLAHHAPDPDARWTAISLTNDPNAEPWGPDDECWGHDVLEYAFDDYTHVPRDAGVPRHHEPKITVRQGVADLLCECGLRITARDLAVVLSEWNDHARTVLVLRHAVLGGDLTRHHERMAA